MKESKNEERNMRKRFPALSRGHLEVGTGGGLEPPLLPSGCLKAGIIYRRSYAGTGKGFC